MHTTYKKMIGYNNKIIPYYLIRHSSSSRLNSTSCLPPEQNQKHWRYRLLINRELDPLIPWRAQPKGCCQKLEVTNAFSAIWSNTRIGLGPYTIFYNIHKQLTPSISSNVSLYADDKLMLYATLRWTVKKKKASRQT